MLNYNGNALRALVQTYFDTLSPGITDGTEISKIYAQVTDTTLRALREALYDWSCNVMPKTLPDNLLAFCFALLPFNDRMTVTRVSRAWRAVALSSPVVWSHIDTSFVFRSNTLLKEVLSRTAQHPLDVNFLSDYPPSIDAVLSALTPHSSHLRSIQWYSKAQFNLLRCRLPLFDSLDHYHPYVIKSDFLGGQVGRLQRLHFCTRVEFPANVCPALSTVTTLEIGSFDDVEHSATFRNLFALCPRLQSLSLRGLKRELAHFLPPGPAPASLRELHLATGHRGYNLMQHYDAWRGDSDNLQDLSLSMQEDVQPDLDPIFDGAVSLSLLRPSMRKVFVTMIADYQDGRKHRVQLPAPARGIPAPMSELFTSIYTLRNVTVVRMQAAGIERFVPAMARLRQLQHIVIDIHALIEHHEISPRRHVTRHTLPLDTLDFLHHLRLHHPDRVSLTVKVLCREADCPPNAAEAGELLGKLASLEAFNLAQVRVRGFSEDVVRDVDVGGVNVEFDTGTVVERFPFRSL